MSLAKGKVFITKEQLTQLFGLPEGVEIIAVKPKELEEGFEFLIMSAEETLVTRKNVPIGMIRRTDLKVERVEVQQPQPQVHKGMAEISFGENGVSINNLSGEVIKQNQKDIKELFNEILQGVRKE